MAKTTITVRITMPGEPKEALQELQSLLDHADPVLSYTTDTYTDGNGEERDTVELMD